MDHLIHVLVREFIPNVEHRHKQQSLGMEGPNLAKKCHCQILTHASETPIEKIKKIDNLHFKVQSSKSNNNYQINLLIIICDRLNFSNISLYKHIAAVVHFFEGVDLRPQPPHDRTSDNISELVKYESPGQPVGCMHDHNAAESIILAANDNIKLLQQLITKAPSDP